MKAVNILKIADIETSEFYPEFLTWLEKEIEPDYKDLSLDVPEQIYNINGIHEQLCAVGEIAPMFENQLKEIAELLETLDTQYFRVLFY